MHCIIMTKKNFKNMFLFEKKNKFLDWHIFHYHVFTYVMVLSSSNQNELIRTKLRQTMMINRQGYPLFCPGTCIIVKNVHCVPFNDPNSSFEVNHARTRSSCWHPSHLYPAISSFSVFIAKKRFSCTNEDA